MSAPSTQIVTLGLYCLDELKCKLHCLSSLPRKINRPRLKMVSIKSGSLHPWLSFGLPLLTLL